jgi:hypothetical protein
MLDFIQIIGGTMSIISKINELVTAYGDYKDGIGSETEVDALEAEVAQLVAALESENAILLDRVRRIKACLT